MTIKDRGKQVSAEVRSGSQRGRAFWPVGLGLLGLVAVFLVGAFLMGDQLRPRAGVEPVPAVAGSAKPSQGQVALQQPAAQPTAAPAATAAVPSLGVPIGQVGLGAANSPLEREIEDAYLHYWDVRAQAYLNLDTSHLGEIMAGAELVRAENQIRQLKAQDRAGKVDVGHHFALVKVLPAEAEVYDDYLNRSVFLNPVTKQEIPTEEPPSVEKVSFVMKKSDGIWKVVDGKQQD